MSVGSSPQSPGVCIPSLHPEPSVAPTSPEPGWSSQGGSQAPPGSLMPLQDEESHVTQHAAHGWRPGSRDPGEADGVGATLTRAEAGKGGDRLAQGARSR